MLKSLIPKFRLDLSARLKYIAEKPAKLKPIVDFTKVSELGEPGFICCRLPRLGRWCWNVHRLACCWAEERAPNRVCRSCMSDSAANDHVLDSAAFCVITRSSN